jgi:hypothetical protein
MPDTEPATGNHARRGGRAARTPNAFAGLLAASSEEARPGMLAARVETLLRYLAVRACEADGAAGRSYELVRVELDRLEAATGFLAAASRHCPFEVHGPLWEAAAEAALEAGSTAGSVLPLEWARLRAVLAEADPRSIGLPVRGSGREPTVEETVELARWLHTGQVDFGGQPYIDHLLAVMGNLPVGSPERRLKAALLHDSIEDVVLARGTLRERRFTADDLRDWGYGEDVVRIVQGVTKKEPDPLRYAGLGREERLARVDADYLDAIRGMAAEGDLDVMEVKRADNLHNGDPSRDRFLSRPADLARTARLRARYAASAAILAEAIDAARALAP